METSTIVIVKNRCQFCYAFHKDVQRTAEHSKRCAFRFAGTFRGVGGILNFACAVCFDVFESREELAIHEELHRFPGGFRCSTCDKLFLNDLERSQHLKHEHEAEITNHQDAYSCDKCGAMFEQKPHLRLHIVTNCGDPKGTQCEHCLPNPTTERVHIDPAVFLDEFPIKIEDEPRVEDDDCFLSPQNFCKTELVDESFTDPLFPGIKVENEVGLDEPTVDEPDQSIQALVASINDFVVESDEAIIIESSVTGDRQRKTEPFVCEYCNSKRSFSKKDAYLKHIQAHGPDGSLIHKCYCCYTYFRTKEERSEHTMAVHPERVTCTMCDKKFTDTDYYYKHMKYVHRGLKRKRQIPNNSITRERPPNSNDIDGQESDCERPSTGSNKKRKTTTVECEYCGQKFSSKLFFMKHVKAHGPDGSLIYKCSCCYTYFRTKEERREHTTIDHSDRVTCTDCDKKFSDITSYYKHMKLAHGQNRPNPTNSISDESSSSQQILDGDQTEPENSTTDESRKPKKTVGQVNCQYCSQKFSNSSSSAFQKHVEAHGPDGTLIHKCYCCYTYFRTKQERMEHTVTIHPERVTCDICDRKFSDTDYLYKHKQFVHDGKRRKTTKQTLYCAKCGESFSCRTLLDDHEKSECGQSPYFKCSVCVKSFCNRFALKTHEKTHTERKFECPLCGKKFVNKCTLKVHSVTHATDKPYQCQKCDKRFADMSYLQTHMALHAEIKRYVCYGCGDRFPTNSALHKHRNTRKDTCALVPIQPLPRAKGKGRAPRKSE